MTKLNDKQKQFVKEYFNNGFNARNAAVVAGYSEKTADSIGCQLLRKPHIKKYINDIQKQLANEVEIDVERLTKEFWANHLLARDCKKFSDSNNALKMIGQIIGAFGAETEIHNEINMLEMLGRVNHKDDSDKPIVKVLKGGRG